MGSVKAVAAAVPLPTCNDDPDKANLLPPNAAAAAASAATDVQEEDGDEEIGAKRVITLDANDGATTVLRPAAVAGSEDHREVHD
jgi:hypothetical protein